MASGGGGRDPAWRHCAPLEGYKNGTVCNYCGLSIKSGGITRLKFHLSHTDPHSNTKKCPNVPPEVKQEMKQLLEQKGKAKAKKAVDMEEIRAELRGIMGGKHHYLIDDDDEEEECNAPNTHWDVNYILTTIYTMRALIKSINDQGSLI